MNESSDITRSSGPRAPHILRRIVDEAAPVSPRDPDHEVAPDMPPAPKSGGEIIADKSISIVDEAASLVLVKYKELRDQIEQAEQMVLASQLEVRDTIRNHMKIVETAMRVQQQIAKQIAESTSLLLVNRANGSSK